MKKIVCRVGEEPVELELSQEEEAVVLAERAEEVARMVAAREAATAKALLPTTEERIAILEARVADLLAKLGG